MTRYFEPYLDVARRHGIGFVLEANTWRANPAWGAQLGYSLDDLAEANRRAVRFVAAIREREEAPGRPIVLNAPIGPEGDAYDPESRMTAEEAEALPLVAGRRARRHGGRHRHGAHDHLRRGGDRHRARGDGARSPRRRVVHGRDRRPAPDAGSRSPRRSSRSTPRRTARRRTSWSTAPTRPTSCPCSTGRGRGTACSASGRTRRRRATPSSTSRRCSTTAIRVELADEYLAIGERLPHLTVLGGCCGTDHRHVGERRRRLVRRRVRLALATAARRAGRPTRTCSVSSVRKRAGSPAT